MRTAVRNFQMGLSIATRDCRDQLIMNIPTVVVLEIVAWVVLAKYLRII
jgi:hypothetical protein